MSAAFQAIISGVRADAWRTGWSSRLIRRPRRRQALVPQDACRA